MGPCSASGAWVGPSSVRIILVVVLALGGGRTLVVVLVGLGDGALRVDGRHQRALALRKAEVVHADLALLARVEPGHGHHGSLDAVHREAHAEFASAGRAVVLDDDDNVVAAGLAVILTVDDPARSEER